jgi:hypothetical protein
VAGWVPQLRPKQIAFSLVFPQVLFGGEPFSGSMAAHTGSLAPTSIRKSQGKILATFASTINIGG